MGLLLSYAHTVVALTQVAADKIERSIKNTITQIESTEPRTVLRKEDFERGTVIIERPGVYVLGEDIEFDPNPGDDWLPVCNASSPGYQAAYCVSDKAPRPAYRLVCLEKLIKFKFVATESREKLVS